jgi:chromosome segregation ATPase
MSSRTAAAARRGGSSGAPVASSYQAGTKSSGQRQKPLKPSLSSQNPLNAGIVELQKTVKDLEQNMFTAQENEQAAIEERDDLVQKDKLECEAYLLKCQELKKRLQKLKLKRDGYKERVAALRDQEHELSKKVAEGPVVEKQLRKVLKECKYQLQSAISSEHAFVEITEHLNLNIAQFEMDNKLLRRKVRKIKASEDELEKNLNTQEAFIRKTTLVQVKKINLKVEEDNVLIKNLSEKVEHLRSRHQSTCRENTALQQQSTDNLYQLQQTYAALRSSWTQSVQLGATSMHSLASLQAGALSVGSPITSSSPGLLSRGILHHTS